jgi:hypothetical protein
MNDDRPAPSDQNEGFGWFCPLPSGLVRAVRAPKIGREDQWVFVFYRPDLMGGRAGLHA